MKHQHNQEPSKFASFFNRVSNSVSCMVGSPMAFIIAFLIVVIWAISGPIFKFSDTWQLVINTGTTIITFLMVFIIQHSQNKDTMALQLKLNELIAANSKASNRLVDIEDLTENELRVLKKFYVRLSDRAEKDEDIHKSHSIDRATENQEFKSRLEKLEE